MNNWFGKHIIIKNIVTITVTCVFLSQFILNDAWAIIDMKGQPYEWTPQEISQFSRLETSTFSIPTHLGEIKEIYKGSTDRFIVHLQDAHCNQYAQHKIADLIDYLNKEYGMKLVNLEGGTGEYDLSIFTSITGEAIRREVADYFLKKGEVNGAEFFAINNPTKVALWGIEDKSLYMANLKVYRDSLSYKENVDKYLKDLSNMLDSLKKHVYSPELLKIDDAYSAYKAGDMSFRDYLAFLMKKAKEMNIPIDGFQNLKLLSDTMELEEKIDFDKANMERNVLIDELKEGLSKNESRELVARSVSFKTKMISSKVFYGYLLQKAKELGLDTGRFPVLSNYVVYISLYENVDRSKVIEEMEGLENNIKELLYRNDTERELNKLSKTLALLKNLFAISLTKRDYEYYLNNKASFSVNNFVDFIKKEAPRCKVKIQLDPDITKLDTYRDDITAFYEFSFKRDEAFLKNLRFTSTKGNIKNAIIMTGGFHTENLCELFKKEGISYVSILPKFTSEKDYKTPYFELLAGRTDDLQQMLSVVVVKASMMQIASMLTPLAKDVWGDNAVITFQLAVRIRAMMLDEKGEERYQVTLLDNKGKPLIFGKGKPLDPIKLNEILQPIKAELETATLTTVSERPTEPLPAPSEATTSIITVRPDTETVVVARPTTKTRLTEEDYELLKYSPYVKSDSENEGTVNQYRKALFPPSTIGGPLTHNLLEEETGVSMLIPERITDATGATYIFKGGLGEGGFSSVFKATRPDGTPVAIKVLKPNSSHAQKVRFFQEYLIMEELRMNGVGNTIQAKGAGSYKVGNEEYYYIVQEFADGGTLQDLIDNRLGHKFDGEEVIKIARQLLRIAESLHNAGVLHMDLKPQNLFYMKGELKIGDFGLSRYAPSGTFSFSDANDKIIGTTFYLPPEDYISRNGYTVNTDLYAIGTILYRLLEGPDDALFQAIFNVRDKGEAFRNKIEVVKEMAKLRKTEGDLLKSFIAGLFIEPDQRGGFRDALEALRELGEVEAKLRGETIRLVPSTPVVSPRAETGDVTPVDVALMKSSAEIDIVLPSDVFGEASDTNIDEKRIKAMRDKLNTADLRDITVKIGETTYRAVRRIGSGAQGVVFEAKEIGQNESVVGESVVIKISPPTPSTMRESTIMKRINGIPGTTQVAGEDVVKIWSDFPPYYCLKMEYIRKDIFNDGQGRPVEASTLDDLLKGGYTFEPEEITDIAGQLLNIIREIHQRGIIHADLKPANIFVKNIGGRIVVVLGDFGISVETENPNEPRKLESAIGTPLFMPLQTFLYRYDAKTDLYALGCILYKMMYGGLKEEEKAEFSRLWDQKKEYKDAIAYSQSRMLEKLNKGNNGPLDSFIKNLLDEQGGYRSAQSALDVMEFLSVEKPLLYDSGRTEAKVPSRIPRALSDVEELAAQAGSETVDLVRGAPMQSLLANIFTGKVGRFLNKLIAMGSTPFHELGHILAARMYGIKVDRQVKGLLTGEVKVERAPPLVAYGGIIGNLFTGIVSSALLLYFIQTPSIILTIFWSYVAIVNVASIAAEFIGLKYELGDLVRPAAIVRIAILPAARAIPDPSIVSAGIRDVRGTLETMRREMRVRAANTKFRILEAIRNKRWQEARLAYEEFGRLYGTSPEDRRLLANEMKKVPRSVTQMIGDVFAIIMSPSVARVTEKKVETPPEPPESKEYREAMREKRKEEPSFLTTPLVPGVILPGPRVPDAILTGNIAGPGLTKTEIEEWRENAMISAENVPVAIKGIRGEVDKRCGKLLNSEMLERIEAWLDENKPGISQDVMRILNTTLAQRDSKDPSILHFGWQGGWMRARVDETERYLLGNKSALAVNIIEYLNRIEKDEKIPERQRANLLAEYILHEALENVDELSHHDIIRLTSSVFNRGEFERPGATPLGTALRSFIDAEDFVIKAKAKFDSSLDGLKQKFGKAGAQDFDFAPSYSALIDDTLKNLAAYLGLEDDITIIAMGSYARKVTPYGTDIDVFLLANEENAELRRKAKRFVEIAEDVTGVKFDFPAYPNSAISNGLYCMTFGEFDKAYKGYFEGEPHEKDISGLRSMLDWRYVSGSKTKAEVSAIFERIKEEANILSKLRDTVSLTEDARYIWRNLYGATGMADVDIEEEDYDGMADPYKYNYGLFDPNNYHTKKGIAGLRVISMIVWQVQVFGNVSYWDWSSDEAFDLLMAKFAKESFAGLTMREAYALKDAHNFLVRLRTAVNIVWETPAGKKLRDQLYKTEGIDMIDRLRGEIAPEVAKLLGMRNVDKLKKELARHNSNVRKIAGSLVDYNYGEDEAPMIMLEDRVPVENLVVPPNAEAIMRRAAESLTEMEGVTPPIDLTGNIAAGLDNEIRDSNKKAVIDSGVVEPVEPPRVTEPKRPTGGEVIEAVPVTRRGEGGEIEVVYEPITGSSLRTDFINQARKLIEDRRISPVYEGATRYLINPDNDVHADVYRTLLNFFLAELNKLPFNNEVGETILLRKDAKEVIERLIRYIRWRAAQDVRKDGRYFWTLGNLLKPEDGKIEDIFESWKLEVFKNEIYSDTGIEGIAYSVDLGVDASEKPACIILDRFMVEQGPLRVSQAGSLRLFLDTGEIEVNLEEETLYRPHDRAVREEVEEMPAPLAELPAEVPAISKAYIEAISGTCKELLPEVRPGENPNVVLIQLTEEQMSLERTKYATIEATTERILHRKYGTNVHVVYYIASAASEAAEKVKELGMIDPKTGKKIDKLNPDLRVIAFADKNTASNMEEGLKAVGIERGDKLSGIVQGSFEPGKVTERFSIVAITVLGLGLIEWERAERKQQSTRNLEDRIKTLLSLIVTNPKAVTEKDANILVRALLNGEFLMDIKKIDYSEIKEFMEQEAAVLESL